MDISEIGGKLICHITGLPSLQDLIKQQFFVHIPKANFFFLQRLHLRIFAHQGRENRTTQYLRIMACTSINVTTFKPHSTRGVSSSKAFYLGWSLSPILKQGQWSNAKTFFNFYCRKIEEDDGTKVRNWIVYFRQIDMY